MARKRKIPSIHGRAVARRQFIPMPPVKKNDEREKIHRTDGFVKSHRNDGFVKSSICKARKHCGVRRTYGCAATTKLPRNAADGLFTKPSKFPSQYITKGGK
jgi:hypothetical protein